jgi:hypothetical protein
MDLINEEKLAAATASVMRPILQDLVIVAIDRAAEKLAPALQKAVGEALDGLEITVKFTRKTE